MALPRLLSIMCILKEVDHIVSNAHYMGMPNITTIISYHTSENLPFGGGTVLTSFLVESLENSADDGRQASLFKYKTLPINGKTTFYTIRQPRG